MSRSIYGAMGLGICLFAVPSFANLNLTNYNGFEVRNSGNTWSFSHESPSSTVLRGGTVLPNAQVSSAQRGLVVSRTLPVGKGLPVNVVAKIPAASLAKTLVGLGRLSTPIGALVGLASLVGYMDALGVFKVKNTENGLVGETPSTDAKLSDGYGWWAYDITNPRASPEAACQLVTGASFDKVLGPYDEGQTMACYKKNGTSSEFVTTMRKVAMSSCPPGWFVTAGGCFQHRPSTQISEPEILEKIRASDLWNEDLEQALKRALDLGVPVETSPPVVSGPSSVLGEKTTTSDPVSLVKGTNTPAATGATDTDPGTKTTTKTETKNATYSGPNVTTSTTITTVTNITNNVTNITITETKTETKENDKEQEDPPVDTPLGDIPELYKQKYPDGIAGVLNTKFDELKATPLFRLPSLLMPSLPSSGSCPSWQLDLNLASWADMGTHTVQAPCWVWDFGKVVVIISALLLARRLIFGG